MFFKTCKPSKVHMVDILGEGVLNKIISVFGGLKKARLWGPISVK